VLFVENQTIWPPKIFRPPQIFGLATPLMPTNTIPFNMPSVRSKVIAVECHTGPVAESS